MNINPGDFKKIVILTGAGISAESGIATFRDSNGLWEQHRIEEVATPEAFDRNPHLVWQFYSLRRHQAAQAKPNLAHLCLVNFARHHPNKITLVTQNVDGLHQRADRLGTLPPLCMHGSLHQSRCSHCHQLYLDDHAYFDQCGNSALSTTQLCSPEQKSDASYLDIGQIEFSDRLPLSPCCQKYLRPHIVWFGEIPLEMDSIARALGECDLFVSIGTSGQVYPAAGFLKEARLNGATTVSINKDPLPQKAFVDQFIQGSAGEILPQFFKLH